jgi:hypothetical protein
MPVKRKPEGDIDYRLRGGNYCPVCGCDEIEGDSVDIQGAYAVQEVRCLQCEHSWSDVYKLMGYNNLVDPDNNEVPRGPTPYCNTDEDMRRLFLAARNAYDGDNSDHIDRILAGEEVGDGLAEFIVAEIRDMSINHNQSDPGYSRARKFREVSDAMNRASEELDMVAMVLEAVANQEAAPTE